MHANISWIQTMILQDSFPLISAPPRATPLAMMDPVNLKKSVSKWKVDTNYKGSFSPKAIEDGCHDASERGMRDLNHCRIVSTG
jgi:hypothetical protein